MAPLLTSDDLDGIGTDAVRSRNPGRYATELVEAVESDRLADPEDAGYALSLAAEIREQAGEHDAALTLSDRAKTAGAGTVDGDWLSAAHAARLLRLGREEEGVAALTVLRPRLHRDASAVAPIVDALLESGRAELAEQWLTAALLTAMEREERAVEGSEEQLDAADVIDELVVVRRDVRSDLGLPPDEYDTLADDLDAAPDLVFWPEAAHAQLIATFPAAAQEYGVDWDAHRALIEGELQAADAEGEALLVEVGTPALLAATLADDDSPVPEPGPALEWPPGRNDPCWCGSRSKYKKCCLPRGRERPDTVEPQAPAAPTVEPPAPASSERVLSRRPGARSRAR